MSILRRLTERRDLHSSNFDPSRIPSNAEGYMAAAGVSVNHEQAMRLTTVFACVRLLSQTIAALPVGVYRKQGDTRMELDLPRWLERPNPDFNRFELIEQTMCSLLLHGNAYLVKVTDDGDQLAELWIMHPEWVKVEQRERTDRSGRVVGTSRVYVVRRGGQLVGEFSPDEIVHIRALSMPGSLYGLSPIDYARQSLGLALAAEEFGARFFSNSATVSGVIEVPAGIGDSELTLMARKWKQRHQGVRNAHEPGFLTGGAKWTPIGIPNDTAQFIETRKMQVEEIARLFGVQQHKVGSMEHATFSNIEHQAIEWVTDGILPWLVRLEMAFNPLVARGAAPDRRTPAYIKWNVDGLLRGDAKSRAEFYQVMRNIGAFNADEIRALEDEPPIKDGAGKTYWRPLNMGDAATPIPVAEPPSTNGNGNGAPDAAAVRLARLLAAGRQ